jgi:hypothetical protein
MSGGPLSPFAHIPVCAEECADFIAEAIGYLRANNIALIEPTVDSETAWVAQVNDIARGNSSAEKGYEGFVLTSA